MRSTGFPPDTAWSARPFRHTALTCGSTQERRGKQCAVVFVGNGARRARHSSDACSYGASGELEPTAQYGSSRHCGGEVSWPPRAIWPPGWPGRCSRPGLVGAVRALRYIRFRTADRLGLLRVALLRPWRCPQRTAVTGRSDLQEGSREGSVLRCCPRSCRLAAVERPSLDRPAGSDAGRRRRQRLEPSAVGKRFRRAHLHAEFDDTLGVSAGDCSRVRTRCQVPSRCHRRNRS